MALSPEIPDPRDFAFDIYVYVDIYLRHTLTIQGYVFKRLWLNWRYVEFSLADESNFSLISSNL